MVKTIWTDEAGQDMAEYGILLGLVALAVIAAVRLLGISVDGILTDIGGILGREV